MTRDMPRHPRLELRPEFPVLDTLRAVGALCVLTTHVAFQSGDYVRHGIVGALFSRLDIGVALFFALSGFLLARPYLARAAAGEPEPSTRHYYLKRFLRIYPVYFVTVVIALTVIEENRGQTDLLEWLRTLTLTDVFFVGRLPQGLTQMWSLSVEATFYLVLPALMWLVVGGRQRSFQPRKIAALLVLGVLFSCWWNGSLAGVVAGVTSGTPLLWLPAHLSWFMVGIGLAGLHVRHQLEPASAVVGTLVAVCRMPGACWAAAAGLLVIAATPLGGPILLLVATPSQSVVKHLAYVAIAALVVATGVFAEPGSRYARAMSVPWLRHFGHISYSTFCIHLVVLYLVRQLVHHELFRGQGPLLWVLTVVGSLVVSEVLYRLVERPALRLKDRGPGSGRSAGQAKSATTTTTTR